MATEDILTEHTADGKILTITLNRPKTLNALTAPMLRALRSALQAADADDQTRAIIVTGAGRAFCAGADIKELSTQTSQTALQNDYLQDLARVADTQKPVIAAVNGLALGGGFELALACDILYAAPEANFSLPEVRIGTIPGGGGTQRLARAVGVNRANELILSGRSLPAAEAAAFGLAARVCEEGKLMTDAMALAVDIANNPPFAVSLAKKAVAASQAVALSDGLKLEQMLYFLTFETADFKEGTQAFLEKRKPNFQ